MDDATHQELRRGMSIEAASTRDIFLEAVELRPDQWPEFLSSACHGDDQLRERVMRLLRAHEQSEIFMARPAAGRIVTLDEPPAERIGAMVGRYKLLEQLGEGGMGVVYVAEQTEPVRRRVALKIIKPGMDTRQVIARFEAERQALAMMDHPNIAKVLDGGTTDEGSGSRQTSGTLASSATGRPYFVMELVRGMPITEYCDQARLSPRGRLELFMTVCHAVQHAHQKGIIHRDIKPNNVLVTLHDGQPVVKVIDFGVAKAVNQSLTERTIYTAHTELIGTPLYMSPEQAELSGLDIDTRSDVYSLGVLLYELLTGQTTFHRDTLVKVGLDEIRRMIREDEPARPSHRISTLAVDAGSTVGQRRGIDQRQLTRTLHGELDWIVMKALEKDRNRRYDSASSIARDLERFLANEPITARPASLGYRIRKWVRRNPASGIVTVVVALAALSLALGGWYHNHHLKRANLALDQVNRDLDHSNADLNSALLTSRRLQAEAIARERTLRLHQYGDDLRLAWKSWNEGRPEEALQFLRRQQPEAGQEDLRGIEWFLLNLHHPQAIRTLLGHENLVLTADVSPDDQWIASGDSGGWVRIWELATGREVKSFQYDNQEVTCLRFSPNGQALATTGRDRTIHVWNVGDWKETAVHSDPEHTIRSLAWSPDSRQIAFGGFDKKLAVWNIEQQGEAQSLAEFKAEVRCVAWSPDGKVLAATVKDDGLYFWDTSTWKSIRIEQEVGAGEALGLAFTADSKWLASAGYGGHLAIHDVENQTLVSYVHTPSQCGSLRFSPDNKQLLVGLFNGAVLSFPVDKDGAALPPGQEFLLGQGRVKDIAFAQAGQTVITAFDQSRVVEVRSATQLTSHREYRYSMPCYWISPSLDRACTIDAKDGVARLMSFPPPGHDFGPLNTQDRKAKDAQFLKRDRLALLVDGSILLYAVPDKRFLGSLKDSRFDSQQFFVSPDGKLIAGCGTHGNTHKFSIWDTDLLDGVLTRVGTRGGDPLRMAFSPDNRLLAMAGLLGPIYLRNIADGRIYAELPQTGQSVLDLTFSPDGQTLAVGSGREVTLWDIRAKTKLATFEGHTDACRGLAYSPDGRTLATVSTDRTVRLWHIPTLQEVGIVYRHLLPLSRVQFLSQRHLAVFSDPDPTSPQRANDILLLDAMGALPSPSLSPRTPPSP